VCGHFPRTRLKKIVCAPIIIYGDAREMNIIKETCAFDGQHAGVRWGSGAGAGRA
jgi:hypothetical protein